MKFQFFLNLKAKKIDKICKNIKKFHNNYFYKQKTDLQMTKFQQTPINTDFKIQTTDGHFVSLKDYQGSQLILFFYAFDNSPLCTKEAEDFTDYFLAFRAVNTKILGISLGGIEKKKKFCYKKGFPFPLASDKNGEISKNFGSLKTFRLCNLKYKYINRSTFLFDTKNLLIKTWRDVKVKGHAAEVLHFAQELHTRGKIS